MKTIYAEKVRKFFLILSLSTIFIFSGNVSYATHCAGGDIQFCWVGPGVNDYRFTYTFYRDCGSPANWNPAPEPASVTVRLISATCGINTVFTLNQAPQPNGTEVSLACGSVLTSCDTAIGGFQGYRKWVYVGNYALPTQCTDWEFSVDVNARNQNITTLNNPGGQSLTVRATLNNVLAPSDCSPGFSNPPLAFLCVNQAMTYNHAAIDADGDSLVYSLVDPLQSIGNVIQPVNYLLPFSTANPLSNTNLVLNTQTGELNVTPTANGELAVLAFRVDEYRNGQLIGSVMRDMQVYVIVCNNDIPVASGLNNTINYAATICSGVQSCFTINSSDNNPNDTVTMTWNNGIPSASFVIAGTPHPIGTFCWTPTAADAGLNVFTVQVRDNACAIRGAEAFTYSITVALPPVIGFAGDPSICVGDSTTITAAGAVNYVWSPNSFINTTSGSVVTVYPPQTQVYTVQATSADGCTSTSSISIIVSPNPIVFTPSNPAVCQGGSMTVNVTGAFYYTWSPATGIISSNPDSSSVVLGPSQTTIYTVVGHSQEGCTGSGTFTFTVNPNPIPVVGSNSPICAGAQLNLTASGGTIYSWTGPNSFSSANQNPSVSNATVGATGNYSVIVTNANNCSATGSVSVTVNANPVPVVGSNSPICAGFPLNLTASGGTGYSWTGPNSFSSGNQNPSISNASVAATGNYSVVVTDANNCVSTGSVSITVNANPVPVVGSNSPICSGSQLNLTASGGTGYSWTGPNSFSSGNQNPSISNASVAATGSYSVVVTDANNCVSTGSVNVTVNANPVPVITPNGPLSFCIGGSVTLDAGTWVSYLWSGQGEITQTINVTVNRTVDVTVMDANGCSAMSAPVTVTVNPLPPAVVTPPGPVLVCSNNPATLSANTGIGYQYQWFFNSTAIPGAVNSQYLAAGAGLYKAQITDANGCSSTSNEVQVIAGVGPDVSISSPPPFGCQQNAIFIGYGPQSITLTAVAPGAASYLWFPDSQTTQSIDVTQPGEYSVIAYDVNGCPSPSPAVLSPAIQMIDIRCGHDLKKVILCQ